ncbi:MAG: Hpt domain-containing protein, partial [Planctomycetaceae bacterium]|nr:Hpt domain-containing protein [Planctomycetaceae bacterium]
MSESVIDIFREEAREHLSALEKGFLDLETASAAARRSLIDSLFRHAHSLKGDAKAVGLLPLKEAAQILEDLLDALRAAPDETNPERINQGLSQLDQVRAAFETWQHAGRVEPSVPTPNVDVPRNATGEPGSVSPRTSDEQPRVRGLTPSGSP